MAGGLVGLPDGALVERHLRGESGLEELYVKYHPKLLDHCMGITRDRMRAEDLAHDTMVRAIARFDRFDGRRKMLPWLKVIATRQAIDGRRRRSHELLVDPGDWAAPDDERECVEDRSVLGLAFAELSHRHREALALRYIQDLDCASAAERLDMSRSAYEQLLARARQRLREEYRKINKAILSVFAPVMAAWRRVRASVGDAAASQWARFDPSAAVSAVMGSTAASLSVAALVAVGGGGLGGDSGRAGPAAERPAGAAAQRADLFSGVPIASFGAPASGPSDATLTQGVPTGPANAGSIDPGSASRATPGSFEGAGSSDPVSSVPVPAHASVAPAVSSSPASKPGEYEDGERHEIAPTEIDVDAPTTPAPPGQPEQPEEPDEPDAGAGVGASYECVPEEQRASYKEQVVVCPVLELLSS